MKICIDAGHGMGNAVEGRFDPGAVSAGYSEAGIVLGYALALRDAAIKRDWTVHMSRVGNVDPCPVGLRAAYAESFGCDVFVSIHCNASDNATASGTETLYRASPLFAQDLQSATCEALGLRDRGCKSRPDLAVLKFARPAALIELGFISNDADRAIMLHATNRERWVSSVMAVLEKKA